MISKVKLYLGNIEKAAGARWMKDQVETIRDTDPRHKIWAFAAGPDNPVHPLAAAWLEAREELAMNEITGTPHFSRSTMNAATFGRVLALCSRKEGFETLKNRLMDKLLFEEAYCELFIASGFICAGCEIKFISGDILVGPPPGTKVRCFHVNPAAAPARETGLPEFPAAARDPGNALVTWINILKHGQPGANSCPGKYPAEKKETPAEIPTESPFVSAVVFAEFQKLRCSELPCPFGKISLSVNRNAPHPLAPGLKSSLLRPDFLLQLMPTPH